MIDTICSTLESRSRHERGGIDLVCTRLPDSATTCNVGRFRVPSHACANVCNPTPPDALFLCFKFHTFNALDTQRF